jgi:hypothetical protein
MSLLLLRLRFFYTLGYGPCHGLNCALCALSQVIDRVGCNGNLFCRRVPGDSSHETEYAHDAADEKQRHPDKGAPKQTGQTAATEGGEKARHADDDKNEANRCDQQAGDAQERARPVVLWSLKFAHKFRCDLTRRPSAIIPRNIRHRTTLPASVLPRQHNFLPSPRTCHPYQGHPISFYTTPVRGLIRP